MLLFRRVLFVLAFSVPALGAIAAAPHERAADEALKMVGAPYRYGGAGPKGFDCSGLVQWSYRHAGIAMPHSTEQQRRLGQRVRLTDLRPGDLVFFNQRGKKNSHVAIYVGHGEIVHAPSSGKHVRRDRLYSAYWKKHVSEARRVSA
jgi:murein DD-endopeptidase